MPGGNVYETVPLLEQDWEGMAVSKASLLAGSEDWYNKRLQYIAGPVCELGCGYGRLLLRLARRGVEVYGCDASKKRIEAAKTLFEKESLANFTFEVCSMPKVPKQNGFQAVILSLNAIGYVLSVSDKRKLFRNIAQILAPRGVILLDHGKGSNLLRLFRFFPGLNGRVSDGHAQLSSHLKWDAKRACICETFQFTDEDGRTKEFRDYFRFTSVKKTFSLLRETGFHLQESCGSFSGAPYRPWSKMVALVAKLGDKACA